MLRSVKTQFKMPQRSNALTLRFILQDTSILQSNLVYYTTEKDRKLRRCRESGCTKYSHQGGFCIAHGGGKRCPVHDCSKSVQAGGRCYKHGGGRRCHVKKCDRAAKRQGYCCRHFKTEQPLRLKNSRLGAA